MEHRLLGLLVTENKARSSKSGEPRTDVVVKVADFFPKHGHGSNNDDGDQGQEQHQGARESAPEDDRHHPHDQHETGGLAAHGQKGGEYSSPAGRYC